MRTDFIEKNAGRNRETQGLRAGYEDHRRRVMQLIDATVKDLVGTGDGSCSSIVLLGAGNCLDVDLPALAQQFQHIHLVDVDKTAVYDAVADSGIPGERVQIHAPVDVAEPLLSLTSRDFDAAANQEAVINVLQQLSSENGMAEVPESDIVVSLCLFSQLLDTLQHIIDGSHSMFEHAVKAIRVGHLRRMLSMLRPGGVAVFVTDVVSSATAPELKNSTDSDLPDLVRKLVNEKNFFSGTNPALVLADLNVLSRLPMGPDTLHTIDPWPWHIGERTYAVYAMRAQKKLPVAEAEEMPNDNPA